MLCESCSSSFVKIPTASGVAGADTTPGFRRVDRRLAILFEGIADVDAEVEVEA